MGVDDVGVVLTEQGLGGGPDAVTLLQPVHAAIGLPVVKGRKTDKEKFSGAEATYTVECMMHDRKALQLVWKGWWSWLSFPVKVMSNALANPSPK